MQKFLLGRGDVGDLSAISATIDLWSAIKDRIQLERKMEREEKGDIVADEWGAVDALMSRLDDLQDLVRRINLAVPRSRKDPAESSSEPDDSEETNGAEVGLPTTTTRPSTPWSPAAWTIIPECVFSLFSDMKECTDNLTQVL